MLNRFVFAAVLVLALLAGRGRAGLLVDVTGVLGSGVSEWTFSGSYIAQNSLDVAGRPASLVAPAIPSVWTVGNLFTGGVGDVEFLPGGTASFTGSVTGASSIDGMFLLQSGASDKLAYFLNQSHIVAKNETLEFSGVSVLPVSVDQLDSIATYPAIINTDTAGQMLTLTIDATVAADFDRDHDVDGADLDTWNAHFGHDSASHADGDADFDGDVDGGDFLVWQRSYQAAESSQSTNSPIPEPTTAALTAVALLAVAARFARGYED